MKKQVIGIIIALTVVSCAVTRPHGPAVSVSDYAGYEPYYYHTEGLKAAKITEDDSLAADYFRRALAADSTFAASYFELAEIMLKGEPKNAIYYSDKANRLDTMNLDYKSQLARVLVLSGDYDDALRIYNRLIVEDPYNVVNYRMLAALYDFRGQPFTAIAILDSAELKIGRMEELSAEKRQLLINVHLYDKAIQETEALIGAYPYNDENYVILATLYGHTGKDSLAMVNYQEALRIDSTNLNTLISLAEYHNNRKDTRSYLSTTKRILQSDDMPVETKVRIFEELTRNIDYYRVNYTQINDLAMTLMVKYPNDFSIVRLYATHLIRTGELELALKLYKSYLEINPGEIEPYFAVLDIEAYQQHPDSVTKYSELALRRFPRNTALYLQKGYALQSMGKEDDALKTYKQALKYAESDSMRSVIVGVVGDLHHSIGEQKKSYKAYERALKYYPDNAVVLNNYAYYLSEEDSQLEKALKMSVRSNELSPTNSTYLDTQAWVYFKMGRFEDAKRVQHQAITFDGQKSDVLLLHYGDILYELGEQFMAQVYWRRALEKGYDAAAIEERLKREPKK